MTVRLSNQTIDQFTAAARPQYDRSAVTPGILHLGMGGFHRAHQAVYTEAVLGDGDSHWGIIGASLRSETMRQQLEPQDWLYTLSIQDKDSIRYQVIGAVQQVLTLARHREQLIAQIASPDLKVITLTITEKGYCLTENNQLDVTNPDIRHDLEHPELPRTAPGILLAGLRERRKNNAGPLTIISCDNLSLNGQVTESVMLSLVDALSADSVGWIRENVTFPSTMIDRIVPQTTAEGKFNFIYETGFEDEGLVICEPFSQWVIEDRFANDRPAWEKGGARFTDDVAAWEEIKLRLLNASHSAFAYLGLMAGYQFIHEAVADALLARFVRYLMDEEVSPVIAGPPGFDLTGYKEQILERFANPAIPYRTSRVATDGSKKLPWRIYPTLMEGFNQGQLCTGLCLVIAAWLMCRANERWSIQFPDPGTEQLAGYHGENLVSRASRLLGEPGKNDVIAEEIKNAVLSVQDSLPASIARAMQTD